MMQIVFVIESQYDKSINLYIFVDLH